MQSAFRFTVAFVVFTLAGSLLIQGTFGDSYPNTPGPKLDRSVGKLYKREIEIQKPEIVLLGDSVLKKAVDAEQFQQQVDKQTYKLDIPGSSSALWYLMIKHEIVESQHKPAYLIVIFRDSMLTTPAFRVSGPYLGLIDKFASPRDTLFLQLAFLEQMTPWEIALDQYLPLYSYRMQIRSALDRSLRHTLPGLLTGCDSECADDAVSTEISGGNLAEEQLDAFTIEAEQVLYTHQQLDFENQVGHSFLPEMIRLAQENGIQLIFVRAPTIVFPEPQLEPDGLETYIHSLEAYLASQSIPLLDLSRVEQIKPEHFVDPLHMSTEGKVIFTEILANALKDYLK